MNKIAIHDSSIRHTTGQAIYIDDISDQENLLHGALVLSKCAYGKIKKIDFSRLKNLTFYTKTVTAKNIPGENEIGPIKNGEPILADDNITYYGQPVAVVLAKTFQEAQYASDLVKIEIDHLDDPILTLDDAYSKNSFHDDPIILEKGSVEKEINTYWRSLTGHCPGCLENARRFHCAYKCSPDMANFVKPKAAPAGVKTKAGTIKMCTAFCKSWFKKYIR